MALGHEIAVAKEQRFGILDDHVEWDRHVESWFATGFHSEDLSMIEQLPARLKPGVTIAVCTYKRAQSLCRLIDSIAAQTYQADCLVIVDASPDDETENAIREQKGLREFGGQFLYLRVSGPLKGLTRQRNFALRWVSTDLVAFFDDDLVLDTACLNELKKAHSVGAESIVGVGIRLDTSDRIGWEWHWRWLFRVVPNLEPGRYHRTGFSTPWRNLPADRNTVEGDWLHGGATMWKTSAARRVGFYTGFCGHGPPSGEDLEFSLRIGQEGKLVLATKAKAQHLHDPSGRPNHVRRGYQLITNLYRIHRRAFPNGDWNDFSLFAYGWSLDTLFLCRHFVFPSQIWSTFQQIVGRCLAAAQIISQHRSTIKTEKPNVGDQVDAISKA